MIDIQILFPPAEEGLDIPPQLIHGHEVFGSEIEPVGRQPVTFPVYPVADDPNGQLGLVDAFRAEEHLRIVEHRAAGNDGVFVNGRLQ